MWLLFVVRVITKYSRYVHIPPTNFKGKNIPWFKIILHKDFFIIIFKHLHINSAENIKIFLYPNFRTLL